VIKPKRNLANEIYQLECNAKCCAFLRNLYLDMDINEVIWGNHGRALSHLSRHFIVK